MSAPSPGLSHQFRVKSPNSPCSFFPGGSHRRLSTDFLRDSKNQASNTLGEKMEFIKIRVNHFSWSRAHRNSEFLKNQGRAVFPQESSGVDSIEQALVVCKGSR